MFTSETLNSFEYSNVVCHSECQGRIYQHPYDQIFIENEENQSCIHMDYFDTTNSPREAELAYANWYYQLPDHRKAQMLCDFYEFGVESVKYNEREKI